MPMLSLRNRTLVRAPTPYFPYKIPARTAILPSEEDLRHVKISSSTLVQIGRAVASSLLSSHIADTKNKYLLIRSFTISQLDLLAAFEKATGTKWKVEDDPVPQDDKYNQAIEKLGKGDYSVFGALITKAFYDKTAGGNFDEEKEFANPLLELPQEDLNEVVAKAVKEVENKSSL